MLDSERKIFAGKIIRHFTGNEASIKSFNCVSFFNCVYGLCGTSNNQVTLIDRISGLEYEVSKPPLQNKDLDTRNGTIVVSSLELAGKVKITYPDRKFDPVVEGNMGIGPDFIRKISTPQFAEGLVELFQHIGTLPIKKGEILIEKVC